MEFVELLNYARIYKNEENSYYGVRDILEDITDLDKKEQERYINTYAIDLYDLWYKGNI